MFALEHNTEIALFVLIVVAIICGVIYIAKAIR